MLLNNSRTARPTNILMPYFEFLRKFASYQDASIIFQNSVDYL